MLTLCATGVLRNSENQTARHAARDHSACEQARGSPDPGDVGFSGVDEVGDDSVVARHDAEAFDPVAVEDVLAGAFPGSQNGDITIERRNVTFYFPLATSIVVSLVLTLLLNLWLRRR